LFEAIKYFQNYKQVRLSLIFPKGSKPLEKLRIELLIWFAKTSVRKKVDTHTALIIKKIMFVSFIYKQKYKIK
jgi:hypothetical protein